MAGGYFDLPLTSPNPQHTSNSQRGASATEHLAETSRSSSSHTSPLLTPNESAPSNRGPGPGGAQNKPRNAGILKVTNRVKFTVSEPETEDEQRGGRSTAEEGGQLPQRPAPTVRIPYADKLGRSSILPPPLTDDGSNAASDVTGSTLHSRASSPGIRDDEGNGEISDEKGRAIHSAQERAQRLASLLGRSSTPKSPRPSPHCSLPSSVASTPTECAVYEDGDEIPLITLPEKQFDDSTDEDEDGPLDKDHRRRSTHTKEAHLLVQQMTRRDFNPLSRIRAPSPGLRSGQVTPIHDRDPDAYVPPPTHYRGGILSTLLKLYEQPPGQHGLGGDHHHRGGLHGRNGSLGEASARGRSLSRDSSKPPKPRKWYDKSPELSTTSLASSAKNSFSSTTGQRPILKRSRSSGGLSGVAKRLMRPQLEDEIRITVHIAEILSRQRYLIRLCQALMKYGAPTHRLEEYMRMTARVLEIDGQFLYIPGCMIISFDDASTHTTEVKLVKSAQGVDLGRLADVHQIYKEVVHDVIGVEEAIQRLDEIMTRKDKFPIWLLIIMHGFSSATVGPFAFGARPIDMPIAFVLGCLVGILQLVLSPRSHLYSNVFEISAAVLTSFLARAFGSISYQGGRLFCFSALAQSSIALILPGYMVLCGSLELQSRSIVAGSVRMVYAIIYSLFLGFGITIGTAVYGLLDANASSDYACPASPITNEYLQRFPFVLAFTFCLTTINQAKWRQVPMMLLISICGYATNYFSVKRFEYNTQVSNALGAFVIGVMGNLYSRLRHGLAAAAILPAIFVQVPSGLAATGSLVSGITSANEITGNKSFYSVINNGTEGFIQAEQNMSFYASDRMYSGVVFDIGYGVVEVAIGITVGLFLAALVVYPLGKKRSGLFSF
ncbi:hypothetical protein VTN77DRAFT_7263 [Rasamsonia byssochlamydoides]|uniref:uncharacterized protein n=1 Tax=Rasamsonia byssochlamydoides TaxID=89139 RepID=UPI003744735D